MSINLIVAENKVASFSEKQKNLLDSLCSSFYVERCCSSSLLLCLKNKPHCTISPRLLSFAEWLITIEANYEKLQDQLQKRYESMTSSVFFNIDTLVTTAAGQKNAPILIVEYISSSCSICKHISKQLYQAVSNGKLKGKARLIAIPFGSNLGNMALLSAERYDLFWDYYLAMTDVKVRFDEHILIAIADSLGIARKDFKKSLYDSKLKRILVDCHQDGYENGVKIVPTFFINGKRYRSYKDPEWVIDAAEYEYEFRNYKKK